MLSKFFYEADVGRSIRYAAPPTGSNRMASSAGPLSRIALQLSMPTLMARSALRHHLPATLLSRPMVSTVSTGLDADEDCLFMNVYAPANASGPLPVLVWIHGGGYGQGNGRLDFGPIINANKNGFVGVSLQYRVCSISDRCMRLYGSREAARCIRIPFLGRSLPECSGKCWSSLTKWVPAAQVEE